MSVELFELAIHMGMELYPCDSTARQNYVNWYIETNGGTRFLLRGRQVARHQAHNLATAGSIPAPANLWVRRNVIPPPKSGLRETEAHGFFVR